MSAVGAIPTPEELAREYETRLAQSARAHYTNQQLLDDWMEYMRPMIAPSSVKTWMSRSRILAQWLDARAYHILSATRKEALDYRGWLHEGKYARRSANAKPLQATTLHKSLSHASLFCNYLRDARGIMRLNPFTDVVKAFVKQHKSELQPELRGLSEDDARAILEGAEGLDDFALFLFLLKTGVRRDEAARVRVDQIDWQAHTVNLEAHAKRSYNKAYFDDEAAYFLKLKVERNKKLFPGNPYLWPSPRCKGKGMLPEALNTQVKDMVKRSPLAKTIKDWSSGKEKVTAHTSRRAFTSWLKKARASAPLGCPSHIVATLRGDSLRSRSELVPDPTQGIYTKLGTVDGIDELRYWYDKCMPQLGARDAWERVLPATWDAKSIAALIRSAGQA
ncbi:MAG: site-specific integrase [Candidatus Thermoplasmatota archaeon]